MMQLNVYHGHRLPVRIKTSMTEDVDGNIASFFLKVFGLKVIKALALHKL